MRVAVAIELTDQERATLDGYARGRSTPARLVRRAKIVLQATKGRQYEGIAQENSPRHQQNSLRDAARLLACPLPVGPPRGQMRPVSAG